MPSIHLSRTARRRHRLATAELEPGGALPIPDPMTARRLADRLNTDRAAGRAPGPPSVSGGELAALAAIHEIGHEILRRAAGPREGPALAEAVERLDRTLGRAGVDALLERFGARYGGPHGRRPSHGRRRGAAAASEGRGAAAATEGSARAEDVGEIVLLAVANENPAATPLRDLFDDRPLRAEAGYAAVLRELAMSAPGPRGRGRRAPGLLELLRAPAAASPTSLAGQLRWIRSNWAAWLADLPELDGRILLALDVMAEEERGLQLRSGPRAGGPGLPAGGVRVAREPPSLEGLDPEMEAYSQDVEWMPGLVLQAKATHVWLEQLSRRHGRSIRTLDAIPDQELDRLAAWGITGLWLIGLWQRSLASAWIKRRRGDAEALASAYAVDDYRIADDLGGEAAWANLRERAAARGIRLAADMVPNHMGIDSRWVVEHPERFLSLEEPPFPAYTFSGPDLSGDPRIEVTLEDGYWDGSDAAVVFRRTDRATGEVRFLYHGNDGTAYPWNDTAQIDYSRAETREAVIAAIVDVARRFPIIRFDAAMVLARRHIRRLWFPEPGTGGAIPSRAEHAMTRRAFDVAVPAEFWREVVDRVAAEAPGTLLLAEAFWLLEGYFVRTLGMHRVYNSAFMHMLRDEDVAGLRRLVRETLEFDPGILGRYVNFLSNPDEQPAIEQFGGGDKYAGAATVLATLPGLPMLAHGQLEGLRERYGHEFSGPRTDEAPDAALVARHEREIVPLLRERARFAGVEDFALYDLRSADGSLDEAVLAYSNGRGTVRSLVVFNDSAGTTSGRLLASAPTVERGPDGTRSLARRTLAERLGVPADAVVAFTDVRSGRTTLVAGDELRDRGLPLELGPYECRVHLEIRELPDPDGRWRRLAGRLAGRPVVSLEEAERVMDLEAVHAGLRALAGSVEAAFGAWARRPAEGPGGPPPEAALDGFERTLSAWLGEVAVATGAPGSPGAVARRIRDGLAIAAAGPALAGSASLEATAEFVGGAIVSGVGGGWVARARFERLELLAPLAAALRPLVTSDEAAWGVATRLRDVPGRDRPLSRPGSRAAGAASAARHARSRPRGEPGS